MSNKHTETPGEPSAHPIPPAQPPSIIQPIIDDLKGRNPVQLPQSDEVAPPRGPLHPPQPTPAKSAGLDQDPGGGYNPDHTFPQT